MAAATEDVVWTNLVYATANGSTIIDQSDGSVAAGGVSTQAIISGDGYMEHTIAELDTNRAAGLSNGDTNQELSDIDFAVRFNGFGNAEVWESGIYRAETTYASEDKFRVAIVGGQVRYSRNDAVFYTSTGTPTYPLVVDVSLMTAGVATISNTIISGNLSGSSWPNEPVGFANALVGDQFWNEVADPGAVSGELFTRSDRFYDKLVLPPSHRQWNGHHCCRRHRSVLASECIAHRLSN